MKFFEYDKYLKYNEYGNNVGVCVCLVLRVPKSGWFKAPILRQRYACSHLLYNILYERDEIRKIK